MAQMGEPFEIPDPEVLPEPSLAETQALSSPTRQGPRFALEVDKINRKIKPEFRKWIMAYPCMMLLDSEVKVRRAIRYHEIEKVWLQKVRSVRTGQSVTQYIIKSPFAMREPTLVLQLRPSGNPEEDLKPLKWMNHYYQKFNGKPLPVFNLDPSVDIRDPMHSTTFGPFVKPEGHLSIKAKKDKWKNDTLTPAFSPAASPAKPPDLPEIQLPYPPQLPPPVPESPPPQPEPEDEDEEEELPDIEFLDYQPPPAPILQAPPPRFRQPPALPPPEPMMLIPADMLSTLNQPPPVVRRKKKLKDLPGAPRSLQNPQPVHLHLYMHKPTLTHMGKGIGSTEKLVVDNELPIASPIAFFNSSEVPHHVRRRMPQYV
ncbi:hypothetical protein DIPPA_07718 [Diplonema papillatum]|nr:hypothetical protein DIPPA_07718 [Diplonema papillatum]